LQPVFCLMHRSLIHSLKDYLASGQRKISAWAQQEAPLALCEFTQTAEGAQPFANANTLQELQDLLP